MKSLRIPAAVLVDEYMAKDKKRKVRLNVSIDEYLQWCEEEISLDEYLKFERVRVATLFGIV